MAENDFKDGAVSSMPGAGDNARMTDTLEAADAPRKSVSVDIQLFQRLSRSRFRSRFHLSEKDKDYVRAKGMEVIRSHARDFVGKKLAPAKPQNDGKQTPMRGHPVFIAQHATATCCRDCLYKWHRIPKGVELNQVQQDYVVSVIMQWIELEMS